ncbi:MAG: hypothetical protein KatS3mg115_0049 [Candidatus Poribacteria bacterium]|nr:MAG: hypothetical protein KatS3mg115_0049 [Candidatus Poribacteria bacterium]
MERRYPYRIELVETNRVSIERELAPDLTVSDVVRVDVPLYRRVLTGLHGLPTAFRRHALQTALEEAKMVAYNKFLVVLQVASENALSIPLERMRQYPSREYAVLISSALWSVMRLNVPLPTAGRSLQARYDEFYFEILPHPQLSDRDAYLVDRRRYRLYLYVEELPDEACVYRSEFVENGASTLRPVRIPTQQLLQELQGPPAGRSERTRQEEEQPSDHQPRRPLGQTCPKCNGRLFFLSPEEAFCMDCDWDNLKVLPFSAAYTE